MVTIYEEFTPAPPMLDPDVERGWVVGQLDGSWLITFNDPSRPPLVGSDAVDFYTNNTSKEDNVMPENNTQPNPLDTAADEATGIIEKFSNPAMLMIGQSAKSAGAVLQAKRAWNDVARDPAMVVGRVTLDLEPEQRGRPQPGRPGIPQVVFLCLPEWHPLFRPGSQEVAAMYYIPSTTYQAERVRGATRYFEEVASSFDASGWTGIIEWYGDLESAEATRAELWQAVQAFSRSTYGLDEADPEEDVDTAAGRFGSREAWGL